jgi:hypothetical protein
VLLVKGIQVADVLGLFQPTDTAQAVEVVLVVQVALASQTTPWMTD